MLAFKNSLVKEVESTKNTLLVLILRIKIQTCMLPFIRRIFKSDTWIANPMTFLNVKKHLSKSFSIPGPTKANFLTFLAETVTDKN